jgi:hypothetical protein
MAHIDTFSKKAPSASPSVANNAASMTTPYVALSHQSLRCRSCLRIFKSATALTQHSESQGTRCRIRDTDEYGQALDDFTAGQIEVNGIWSDGTVRYKVVGSEEKKKSDECNDDEETADTEQEKLKRKEKPKTGAEAVLEKNRLANDRLDGEFYAYWQRNMPQW